MELAPLLVAIAIAAGAYLALVLGLFVAGRGGLAREIVALVPNLIALFAGLATDARVPRSSKAVLALGALWFASPIDLIPEFIPVVGPLDDAIVAALILRHVLRSAPREAIADHWRGDPSTLERILRAAGRGAATPPA